MQENIQNYIVSPAKREKMVKEALNGSNNALADKIKEIGGFEINGSSANDLNLAEAYKIISRMTNEDLIAFISQPVYTIVQGDTELLSGDEVSMNIIFNNLTGRNYSGVEYENYLNWAESNLHITIKPKKLFKAVR